MDKAWQDIKAIIKREKLLVITNIIVMTITFVVLGVLVYVIALSQTTLKYLEKQAQVTIFFKDDFVEQNILSLKDKLTADKRVNEVKYVSKEDAYKIFRELNQNEPILLESITSSILPASLEVRAKNVKDLPVLADEFSKIDGVEEVGFFRDVIDRFRSFSTTIYIGGIALVFIFILISYSVVISTLRNTINAKGTELEVLKLVGASDDYVKKPLLAMGTFFGIVSSAIAGIVMIIFGVAISVSKLFPNGIGFGIISGFYIAPYIFGIILALLLVISGACLGYVGSSNAVKKYLKY